MVRRYLQSSIYVRIVTSVYWKSRALPHFCPVIMGIFQSLKLFKDVDFSHNRWSGSALATQYAHSWKMKKLAAPKAQGKCAAGGLKTRSFGPFAVVSFLVGVFCFCLLFIIILSEETYRCLIVSMPLLFHNTCLKYKYKTFNSSTASHTVKLLVWSAHGKRVLFPTEQGKHCTDQPERFRLDSGYAPSLLTRRAVGYWRVCMYWDEKEVWFTLSFLLFSCHTPHKWPSHEQKWRR